MAKHRSSAKARRSAARLAATQALYQIMLINTPVEQVIGEFVHFRFGAIIDGDEYVSPDPQLFADIVRGTAQKSAELEPTIRSAMDSNWSLDRAELLLKVVLKAGTWELLENPLVPAGIIISEYISVSQAFFGGKEPAMVNAVLDRLAKKLRSEGTEEGTDLSGTILPTTSQPDESLPPFPTEGTDTTVQQSLDTLATEDAARADGFAPSDTNTAEGGHEGDDTSDIEDRDRTA